MKITPWTATDEDGNHAGSDCRPNVIIEMIANVSNLSRALPAGSPSWPKPGGSQQASVASPLAAGRSVSAWRLPPGQADSSVCSTSPGGTAHGIQSRKALPHGRRRSPGRGAAAPAGTGRSVGGADRASSSRAPWGLSPCAELQPDGCVDPWLA